MRNVPLASCVTREAPVSKELPVIRFRFSTLVAAGAIAVIAAGFAHPAAAAPKSTSTASPSPAPVPSPTATPETLDKQIPRLESVLKANPNDKDTMTALAMDYLQVNRPDLSAQLTQKLLQGGTKSAQIYYADGEAETAIGKADAGIASMEQAANLEPTNILVLQSLTQMYMRANRPADAERVAKRALTFNATSKEAAENYGFVLAAEKKYDEARTQFEAAAKIDPKDAHPIVLEAQTYEDANALPLAMQQLDRALAIDPNGLEALAAKAELASAQHDIKTAVATYNQILPLMPDDARKAAVVDQIGIAYAREKMAADADAAFRRAIDSYGSLPSAHLAYGDYLASTNDKAGAVREWTTAVGPNRDNPEALARLGQAAAVGNDFNKAIDNYKRLTEVDASDPRAYLMLGQVYMANKNFTSARDTFKAAYNLQPSADSLVALAAADQATRNYNEAVQIYEAIDKNAQPLMKAHPELLYSMGLAYRSANQPQKAKATYQRLLAVLKPNTQGYTQVKNQIADIDRGGKPSTTPKKTAPAPTATPKK
jgi:tetratricopeptide (TPR) repeat protein